MKKGWFLLLFLFIGCLSACAQNLTKMSGYGYEMNILSATHGLFLPNTDTTFTGTFTRTGAMVYRTVGNDHTLYIYNGSNWDAVGSGTLGDAYLRVSGDTLYYKKSSGGENYVLLPGGDWNTMVNKPDSFLALHHTHPISDIIHLQDSLNARYTKTQIDSKLVGKQDTGYSYSKDESDNLYIPLDDYGQPNGVTPLGPDKKVPLIYLPTLTSNTIDTLQISGDSLRSKGGPAIALDTVINNHIHDSVYNRLITDLIGGSGVAYSESTRTISAKISAASGNALTTDGGGGLYVSLPISGTDTTVKGVIYDPKVDDTIRLTTNTLDTIKARMHLNTAIDSGVFIPAQNQMHLYRFNGDSIVMTILGGAVTSVNGNTGNVQLNLSILGRVISLTDGSSVTIPHDSLNLSGNNLSIKGSNTLDIGVPIKDIVSDTADAIRATIHNLADTNLTQDSVARIYSTNKGVLYLQDTSGTTPGIQFRFGPDSLVQTLTGSFKTTYTLKNSLINMDVYDRTGGELQTRAQVNRSGLYLYTGVSGRDAGTQTLTLGAGGTIQAVSFRNNAAQDSVVTGDTTGLLHFKYMPSADSIMLRNDLQDSLAGKLIFDTTTNSLALHKIHSTYGMTVTGGDSTVLTQDVNIVPDTTSSTGLASKTWVQNQGYGSGGGSGTDTVHQASAPLTLTRSGDVVTYGFDTTQFKTPTTDGKILLTGDMKMWHNAYLSLNPDSIWGAYPLGDSVSLPNTNLGNSDLSLTDAARWINLNDGGLYIIDSSNYTSPNSDYIANFTKDGLNVHKGKLTVANSVAGTPGTDSIWVKHTGGDFRVISGGYYATPSQVVDSITAHTGTNTNLATNDLSLASAVARKFDLNGGSVTFTDANRTYGDPVAILGRNEIQLTTEDDAGSYSANYYLDYGTSPSITESVLADGGNWTRAVNSSGWLWKTGTTELMRLNDEGLSVDAPLTITPRSGSSASFHIGSDFISGVNYGGTGGTFKIDSVGNVTFPRYAGAETDGKVASFDDEGNIVTVSAASLSASAPNIITSTSDSSWTLSATDNIVVLKPGTVWHETITLPSSPSLNQEIKIYWITSASVVSTDIIPGSGQTFYAADGTDYSGGGETFVGDTFKFFLLKYDTATTTWYMLSHGSTN